MDKKIDKEFIENNRNTIFDFGIGSMFVLQAMRFCATHTNIEALYSVHSAINAYALFCYNVLSSAISDSEQAFENLVDDEKRRMNKQIEMHIDYCRSVLNQKKNKVTEH